MRRLNVGPQKDADVKPLSRFRLPAMIAASASRRLLIGKENRSVLSSIARSCQCISIRRRSHGIEIQLAREDSAGELSLQRDKMIHAYAGSATMLIEMSAAFAECVSAPTLMKSGPASA
jgi:hypothetical protein